VTAPAVVRRWNDPPPVRAGRAAPEASPAASSAEDGRPARGAMWVAVRDQLVRFRRAVPLGAVLLTGLVAHAAVAPHLAVRGTAPDVLLVTVVAVAAGRGARAGAAFGFAAGLGADLFLATPLGTSALAYTLVGHVVGRSATGPRPAGAAAALCRPGSPCFACRTGRRHRAEPAAEPAEPARPTAIRRRAAARRALRRRSIVLVAAGVATGRLATAVVATTLGGVPFVDTAAILRIAGAALVAAPLGPLAFAALRRVGRGGGAAG
jgi:hypothetical protein